MLEQDAALAVDDRLGQARRPRRVENPERVGERELGERQLPLALHRRQRGGGVEPLRRGIRVQIGNDDRVPECRQLALQLGDRVAAIEVLAPVAVAVDGEQDLRLDLRETVDDGADAEVRRAARPRRADARAREEDLDRLGDVGQVADDPVAGLDAQLAQSRGDACDLRAQLAPGDLGSLAHLGLVDHRDRSVVAPAEDVLRVGQPRAGEPVGAGHLTAPQHPLVRALRLDLEEVPDRGPEGLDVVDRPLPEIVVAVEVHPPLRGQPPGVGGQRGPLDGLGRRFPEQASARVRGHGVHPRQRSGRRHLR